MTESEAMDDMNEDAKSAPNDAPKPDKEALDVAKPVEEAKEAHDVAFKPENEVHDEAFKPEKEVLDEAFKPEKEVLDEASLFEIAN